MTQALPEVNLRKLSSLKVKSVSMITAATLVALVSCAKPLPDLRPAVVVNTVVPNTDITINAEQVLETHNLVRQSLGVPGLKWSNQMAVYATEWALFLANEAGCTLQYRGPSGLPLHKNGLGENLYKRNAIVWADGRREVDKLSAEQVVLSWATQSADYEYTSNSCGLNKECSDYTQLVWRDSKVVGCGAASCANQDQLWVCNYDPPGNFLNQRPY